MARGWESKSVEQQQAEIPERNSAPKVKLSPSQRDRLRRRQSLELSRARILDQLQKTGNPNYRETLQASLRAIDTQIAELS